MAVNFTHGYALWWIGTFRSPVDDYGRSGTSCVLRGLIGISGYVIWATETTSMVPQTSIEFRARSCPSRLGSGAIIYVRSVTKLRQAEKLLNNLNRNFRSQNVP
jgi:hypothetical protein